MASKTGWTRSNAAFSPPTMSKALPFERVRVVPEMGASIIVRPALANSAATARLASGSMVLMSRYMASLRKPAMIPFSPSARERTAAESVTMEKTISDSNATSRGVLAQSMPSLNMRAAFSLVRFQPVTVWPAASKRGTMAWPMSPRPTKPIFTSHLFLDLNASAFPEFHDRRVVEVFLGRAFDVVVGFAGGGGGGQSDAELIGEFKREPEILVHQAQRKTRNVFAFE